MAVELARGVATRTRGLQEFAGVYIGVFGIAAVAAPATGAILAGVAAINPAAAGVAATATGAASRVLHADNLEELADEVAGLDTVVLGNYRMFPSQGGIAQTIESVLQPAANKLGARLLDRLAGTIEALRPQIDAAERIVFFTASKLNPLTAQELEYVQSRPELLAKTVFVYGGMNIP